MIQIFVYYSSKIKQQIGTPEASCTCGMLGIHFYLVANISVSWGSDKSKAWRAKIKHQQANKDLCPRLLFGTVW